MAEDFKTGDRVQIGSEPEFYTIEDYGRKTCKLKPEKIGTDSLRFTFCSTSRLVKVGGTAPQKPVEQTK